MVLHNEQKTTFYICEKKKGEDQLRSNCEADQRLCFGYTDSKWIVHEQYLYFLNPKRPAIFCACIAWFVLDMYGNHIVDKLMTQLNCCYY